MTGSSAHGIIDGHQASSQTEFSLEALGRMNISVFLIHIAKFCNKRDFKNTFNHDKMIISKAV